MEIVLEKSQVVDLRLDLHKQGISIGDDLNLVVNDQDGTVRLNSVEASRVYL